MVCVLIRINSYDIYERNKESIFGFKSYGQLRFPDTMHKTSMENVIQIHVKSYVSEYWTRHDI